MRRRRLLWLGVGVGGVLAALSGRAAPPDDAPRTSPGGFVKKLYDRYTTYRPAPLFEDAASIFDKPLLALIRQDRELADGEAGLLDFDPICDCQDAGGLHGLEISVRTQTDDAVAVHAGFTISADRISVDLSLVHRAPGWRVADIAERDIPSLRRYLETGLQRLRSLPR